MKNPQLNHTSVLCHPSRIAGLALFHKYKSIETIESIKVLEVFTVHLYTFFANYLICKNYQMQPSFSMRHAS